MNYRIADKSYEPQLFAELYDEPETTPAEPATPAKPVADAKPTAKKEEVKPAAKETKAAAKKDEPKAEPKADAKAEPKADAKADTKTKAKAKVEAEADHKKEVKAADASVTHTPSTASPTPAKKVAPAVTVPEVKPAPKVVSSKDQSIEITMSKDSGEVKIKPGPGVEPAKLADIIKEVKKSAKSGEEQVIEKLQDIKKAKEGCEMAKTLQKGLDDAAAN